MSVVKLNFRPDRNALRRFGWASVGSFLVLALLAWNGWMLFRYAGDNVRTTLTAVFGALAAATALSSWLFPRANRVLYLAVSVVGYPIGLVISYVLMAVLFYGLITPAGIVFRMLGRDPLKRTFDPGARSYWVDAKTDKPEHSYYRQF
jgi:hypothetical protein